MSHPLVVNIRTADCDVNIMRPGPWGNPFKIGDVHPFSNRPRMTREDVIHLFAVCLADPTVCRRYYRQYERKFSWMRKNLHLLAGKRLGCGCAPLACHGDVLARRAKPLDTGDE